MSRLKCLQPRLSKSTAKPLWTPDARRGSRHARGYDYAWEKRRERILERDAGLCQPHLKRGIVQLGNEVDHITPKAEAQALGWSSEQIEADANLQTICRDCHDEKSRAEMKRARGGG